VLLGCLAMVASVLSMWWMKRRDDQQEREAAEAQAAEDAELGRHVSLGGRYGSPSGGLGARVAAAVAAGWLVAPHAASLVQRAAAAAAADCLQQLGDKMLG
jgi:hypothetical protein